MTIIQFQHVTFIYFNGWKAFRVSSNALTLIKLKTRIIKKQEMKVGCYWLKLCIIRLAGSFTKDLVKTTLRNLDVILKVS